MLEVRVSQEERAAGRLRPESLRSAALLLETSGYVVLRGALPDALVAQARHAAEEIEFVGWNVEPDLEAARQQRLTGAVEIAGRE